MKTIVDQVKELYLNSQKDQSTADDFAEKLFKILLSRVNSFNAIISPHYDSNGYLDGGWIIRDGVLTGHIDPRGEPGNLGEPGSL